jgi:hypothetical protein
MSDKLYAVSAEWKARAHMDEAKYKDAYARSLKGPERLLGQRGQAHPLVQGAEQDQERLLRARQRLDQMVRGWRHQRLLQLHRSASS